MINQQKNKPCNDKFKPFDYNLNPNNENKKKDFDLEVHLQCYQI